MSEILRIPAWQAMFSRRWTASEISVKVQAARVKTSHEELIRVTNERLEPSPWLARVGWAVHLKGLSARALFNTTTPINEDEVVLQAMWATVERVLDQARATSTPNTVGLAVLFEAQRTEAHVKPRRPFDNRMEDDTSARYKGVWLCLLCVWFRTQEMDDDKRPPYKLTPSQAEAWDLFGQMAEAASTGTGDQTQEKLERAALDMLIGMLDHQLKGGDYSSALLSALAVMGIAENGGWVQITDYTTKYSAVIRIARMLVIHLAYTERNDEVAELERSLGKDEAEDAAQSLFQHTRAKVRRFMTRTTGDKDAEPTPMDWILETRTYGMHIQYNTAAAGVIDWVGDRVSYRRVRFTMGQLSDALRELVRETRELLAELTATEDSASPDGPETDVRSQLPAIPWPSIEDDHSETKPGYSFLADDRNSWVSAGDGWLFTRLARSPAAAERWGLSSMGNGHGATDRPFRPSTVQEFGRTFERLRERLWMLLHMLGGQPARASELAGLRTVNTVNGGVRNIMVHDKMLCFITAYHKGYRTTGQAKVIHRYLPREVGELIIWYLWLILPFWQEVQGIMNEASGYSAFLWADDITRQRDSEESSAAAGLEEQSDNTMDIGDGNNHITNADEAGDESTSVGDWTWKDERTWTTDRARRIMQWHRFLGFGAKDSESKWGSAGCKRKKTEAYEGPRMEARLRRFEKLRRMDLEGQLRQMTGDDSAGFRGNQREAVVAIASGHTPIVQVMGTGGGKSVSFMLPAFCSPDGVTVVVTPLVALRTDLHRRCVKAGITSHVWQSRKNNQAASIILVTPESAVTMGFRDFIARLEGRQALDRVIVDECHVVLEGSRSFRPRLRELGEAIREFGVQTICLTATLAPTDEAAFFHAMRLEAFRVSMFRTATTRKNIRYSVVAASERPSVEGVGGAEQDEDDAELEKLDAVEAKVCQVAVQWVNDLLASGGRGKAVVYATSIERVERLGSALGCATFFSDVDSTEGKAARLEAWRRSNGAEGVVVATNALGLGIDIPDVRLVIHADMPTGLRRFVQESGRAGRDGQPSASVVVCRSGNSSGLQWEAAVEEYLAGDECRRIILDRVMDGRSNRNGCEDDEEVCDVCRGDGNGPGSGSGSGSSRGSEGLAAEDSDGGRAEFHTLDRHAKLDQWRARTAKMGEAGEIEAFLAQLHWRCGRCALCFGARDDDRHEFPRCPRKAETEWKRAQQGMRTAEREMFGRRRLERFSGCFDCGLPQEFCERWEGNASNLFQMAQSTVSKEIELDHKNCQFNGCIGAIDGTLIAAHVAAASQKRFFNRKGFVSQNVFAAVTFDGLFSYVLAGAEGSMNDATLIRHAQSRSFDVPLGRYYLADAGFACERGIVTPFPGERYHLNETAGAWLRPTTAKELYNMWHARMRGIVEKVFSRLKRRWKITRSSPPEYSFADQIRMVYAVTALYNYQLLLEIEDDVLSEDQIDILRQAAERADRTVADFDGKVVRHNAAVWTWQERQQFVEALEEEENEQ
ncbi:ATP-dependent DNA helicase Q-like 3 [Colletotrichum fructicola]|nr:ATP-dependent DNA helicase Q-like 3 [Colletotrichum fructicola]